MKGFEGRKPFTIPTGISQNNKYHTIKDREPFLPPIDLSDRPNYKIRQSFFLFLSSEIINAFSHIRQDDSTADRSG